MVFHPCAWAQTLGFWDVHLATSNGLKRNQLAYLPCCNIDVAADLQIQDLGCHDILKQLDLIPQACPIRIWSMSDINNRGPRLPQICLLFRCPLSPLSHYYLGTAMLTHVPFSHEICGQSLTESSSITICVVPTRVASGPAANQRNPWSKIVQCALSPLKRI